MQQEELLARLERVESQNRKIKLFGGIALGAMLTGLGVSFAAPAVCNVVTAERFQLVDAYGNQRGLLDAYGRDEVIFKLNQKNGKAGLTMQVSDSGPAKIAMTDKQGRTRLTMAMDGDGVPEFAFYDEKGEVLRRSIGGEKVGYLEKNSR